MKVYPKHAAEGARIQIGVPASESIWPRPATAAAASRGDSQRLRNLILIYDLSVPRIDSGPYPLSMASSDNLAEDQSLN